MIEVEIDKSVYLDCYQHLLEENDIDIELIWGGRDGGKSKFVAQHFTEECMRLDYFRCLLIKQTHESIKDAQWQMIKDVVDGWGVNELFSFHSSPLIIRVLNGNTYLAKGTDKPGKIRSIANPSHAWIEEGNQISEESFITILTGLRSDFGKVKIYITFNPESEDSTYEDFWLYKMFFAKYFPQKNFIGEIKTKITYGGIDEEVTLKYRSTHTTYHDNPYVSPQRKSFHESLKETNYYWYTVFTLGEWGNVANDSPWAFAFDRKKHIGRPVANQEHELYISFDFNRNPMCCSIIQFYDSTVKVIKVYKLPNMGCTGVCDRIKVEFPNFVYIVTGDYSGNTDTTLYEDQVSNYTVIQDALNLADAQIQIMPNPKMKQNRALVNTVLQYVRHEIHEEDARPLIWDMENVIALGDGTIDKGDGTQDRKDPKKQADALDTYRYFVNKFLREFIDIPYS